MTKLFKFAPPSIAYNPFFESHVRSSLIKIVFDGFLAIRYDPMTSGSSSAYFFQNLELALASMGKWYVVGNGILWLKKKKRGKLGFLCLLVGFKQSWLVVSRTFSLFSGQAYEYHFLRESKPWVYNEISLWNSN